MAYTIYKADENPAVSLYKYWRMILDGVSQNQVSFGPHGWHLRVDSHDRRGRPVISLDYHFTLTATGRFRLGGMWGYQRRNILAQWTFLGWGHFRGYQWTTDIGDGSGYYGQHSFENPNTPEFYTTEELMRATGWYGNVNQPWLALERRPDGLDNSHDMGWRIVPAINQAKPDERENRESRVRSEEYRQSFAQYDKLIERRYRQLAGLTPKRSVRPATVQVRHGGKTLNEGEAVEALVAMLDVRTPARTTPYTRPKEAPDGTDSLAATQQLRPPLLAARQR